MMTVSVLHREWQHIYQVIINLEFFYTFYDSFDKEVFL